MKKLTALFLTLLLLVIFTACEKEEIPEDTNNVTITIPTAITGGTTTAGSYAEFLQNAVGVESVEVNEDGSITVIMTQEGAALQISSMKSNVEIPIEDMLMYTYFSGEKPFEDITYNEDLTEINFTISQANLSIIETDPLTRVFRYQRIAYFSYTYQAFNQLNENTVTLKFIDPETNEVYMTYILPDDWKPVGNENGENGMVFSMPVDVTAALSMTAEERAQHLQANEQALDMIIEYNLAKLETEHLIQMCECVFTQTITYNAVRTEINYTISEEDFDRNSENHTMILSIGNIAYACQVYGGTPENIVTVNLVNPDTGEAYRAYMVPTDCPTP